MINCVYVRLEIYFKFTAFHYKPQPVNPIILLALSIVSMVHAFFYIQKLKCDHRKEVCCVFFKD